MPINGKINFAIVLLMALSVSGWAQNSSSSVNDTLPAAVKTSYRFGLKTIHRPIDTKILDNVVSVAGFGDAVSIVKRLPGVSSGLDGTSSYYVRGGTMSGNITTLDGVRLYGSGHLLGLTTSYNPRSFSLTEFQAGGFSADIGNITSSHLRLESKSSLADTLSASFSVSNFMVEASAEAPVIKDRLTLSGVLRVSPIKAEYELARLFAPQLGNANAAVYDLFLKASYQTAKHKKFYLSIFNSHDKYSFSSAPESLESLGWSNIIVNFWHPFEIGNRWNGKASLSFNNFSNNQGQQKTLSENKNILSAGGRLIEVDAKSSFYSPLGRRGQVTLGADLTYSRYSIETSCDYSDTGLLFLKNSKTSFLSHTVTGALFSDLIFRKLNKYEISLAGRVNYYSCITEKGTKYGHLAPEGSFSARVMLLPQMGIEATADYRVQYGHTLEGMPMGWSVDLLVPSDAECPPESSLQFYAGVFSNIGNHHLKIGAYHKSQNNLIYYADASHLFSSSPSVWKDYVKIGTGISKGVEFSYDKEGKKLEYSLTYTLSKTDRKFNSLNDGNVFPAKFDRRHILNANISYTILSREKLSLRINSAFTYQSGHHETVPSAEYPGVLLAGESIELDYFTTINNYTMPAYIRWDVGCQMNFSTSKRIEHSLGLGVFNVLNRHNPSFVTFDTDSRKWQAVSLFPVFPSVNYTLYIR